MPRQSMRSWRAEWAGRRSGVVEPLEPRLLFSFSATLSGGTLTLSGSLPGRNFRIRADGSLLANNQFGLGAPGFNSPFDFDSTVPGDQKLVNTSGELTINGVGSTSVAIGSKSSPASLLTTSFMVRGGGLALAVNDAADATARSITITSSTIRGLGPNIDYGPLASLSLTDGTGADNVTVQSLSAPTAVVSANGADTLMTGLMDDLLGGLSVSATSGTDTLLVDDGGASQGGSYTVSSNVITKAGSNAVTFDANTTQIEIRTSAFDDHVTVGTTSATVFIKTLAGNDTVAMDGSASLNGGTARGGVGFDTLDYFGYLSPVAVNLDTELATGLGGFSSFEGAIGTAGNDTLVAANNTNCSLAGGAGDDFLLGGTGDDTICGNAGNDLINGGAGNDSIQGGLGNDAIGGGQGRDTLFGGAGDDTVEGGNGDDSLQGGAGNDSIDGGQGNDMMCGGLGNDTLNALGGFPDTLMGGAGINMASYDVGLDSVTNCQLTMS